MRVVPEVHALEWSIFVIQRLALHQNGVEFRQQFNGAIRTAPNDDVRRRLKFVTYIHTGTRTHTVTERPIEFTLV